MKPFIIWLIVFALLFGSLFACTHIFMSMDPTHIAIAFDDSYYMKDVWPKVQESLKSLEGRRYTEFFILSNKEKISKTWEKELNLSWFSQTRLFLDEYKLSDMVNTTKYPELNTADIIYVLSPKPEETTLRGMGKVIYIQL